jgi:hypothetical protein
MHTARLDYISLGRFLNVAADTANVTTLFCLLQ